MTMVEARPVLAAGAVCWRLVDGKPRVLLVYRASRKDVSLPKGKVDPGETLPATAVREILEETGLAIVLGAPLGEVHYPLPSGRNKIVHYWSAEVDEHVLEAARFTANDEIAALEWVSLAKARKRLSYPHDLEILETFARRVDAGTARTFAIIALRHAKAVPSGAWDGPDASRPLLQRGSDNAETIAQGLAAYAPVKIFTSPATRCVATVAPVARITDVFVKESETLSQEVWELGDSRLNQFVAKRLAKRRTVIVCSHGPVMPDIIGSLASLTATTTAALHHAASLDPGEYAVLHFAAEGAVPEFVTAETHGPSAS